MWAFQVLIVILNCNQMQSKCSNQHKAMLTRSNGDLKFNSKTYFFSLLHLTSGEDMTQMFQNKE